MLEITDKETKESMGEILKNKNTDQKAMIKYFSDKMSLWTE